MDMVSPGVITRLQCRRAGFQAINGQAVPGINAGNPQNRSGVTTGGAGCTRTRPGSGSGTGSRFSPVSQSGLCRLATLAACGLWIERMSFVHQRALAVAIDTRRTNQNQPTW